MKIVISCSMKYRQVAIEVVEKMKSLGLTPLFPNLSFENNEEINTLSETRRLAEEHYAAIEQADAAYFIVPQGYMGTSCKLELGYAIAMKKPIYFSEPTNDSALDCYIEKCVSLDEFL